MLSRSVLFGLLAAACVAAAGGGAYLASRESSPVSTAAAPVSTLAGSVPTAADAAAPVSETEALVKDEPLAAASTDPNRATEPAATMPALTAAPLVRSQNRVAKATPPRAAPRRDRGRAEQAERSEKADAGYSALEKPWPSRDTSADSAPATESARPVEPPEPLPPPPPAKQYEELIVSADSVIGLQVETTVNSEQAKVEDKVEARVTRDVTVGNAVAIPAGARALGSITSVDRGGKMKERARLGIRFHTLVLADGTQVPIQTETIFREGTSPTGKSAAKIGGAAVGGAIIGGILGGTKGAIMGGSVGAAGGTAAAMAGDRNAAVLQSGTTLTVRLSSPVTVTVEK